MNDSSFTSSIPLTDASKDYIPSDTSNVLDKNTLGFNTLGFVETPLPSDKSELQVFLEQYLQGFKTEWDNYTSYLDSQNSIQRQWLEAMAEKSFQRELEAQSTAYQREFDAMRAAGLNPYAYYLNGGSSNLTAPKYSVNSTSYATAARPQGLDNAFQLFLKQLETYSNTAYREDITELQKQQLEMQKWQIVASFANSLSKAWSSSQNNSNYIQ